MSFNPLSKTLTPLLRQTLTAYSARNAAIAENIANVETKGFRPLKVNFEDALQRALEPNKPSGVKTHDKHMNFSNDVPAGGYRIEETDASVNLEHEMAELAENQIRFELVSRALRGNYEKIKMAIRGRLG